MRFMEKVVAASASEDKRKKQYKELEKTAKKDQKVYSRDKTEIGFILGDGPDYSGEAGPSGRKRVLWKDGKITKPTDAGMKSYKGGWILI